MHKPKLMRIQRHSMHVKYDQCWQLNSFQRNGRTVLETWSLYSSMLCCAKFSRSTNFTFFRRAFNNEIAPPKTLYIHTYTPLPWQWAGYRWGIFAVYK